MNRLILREHQHYLLPLRRESEFREWTASTACEEGILPERSKR